MRAARWWPIGVAVVSVLGACAALATGALGDDGVTAVPVRHHDVEAMQRLVQRVAPDVTVAGSALFPGPDDGDLVAAIVERLDREPNAIDGAIPTNPWGGLRMDVELLDTLQTLGIATRLQCTVDGDCEANGEPVPGLVADAVLAQVGLTYVERATTGVVQIACDEQDRVGWTCRFSRTEGVWMRLWVAPLAVFAVDDRATLREIDTWMHEQGL